jgi:DNA-binding Lrp family transcriptional regulator
MANCSIKFCATCEKGAVVNGLEKLDRIDIKILYELQKNGRISNVDLSERVHLSPSPCLSRVKRLQTAGYITGYAALVDVAKLGETLTVFTEITLRNHRSTDFGRFLDGVRPVEEIMECHMMSGGYDFLLKFVARGIVNYQETIERLLEAEIGIDKYFSYVVLNTPIQRHHMPLGRLFQEA